MNHLQRFAQVPDQPHDALRIETVSIHLDNNLNPQDFITIMVDIFSHDQIHNLHRRKLFNYNFLYRLGKAFASGHVRSSI